MRRVRVKICGITNKEDLEIAVDAGADALGFVVDVPESPRSVSLDRARDLVEATPPFVQGVIVSVFQTFDRLRDTLFVPCPRCGAIGWHAASR